MVENTQKNENKNSVDTTKIPDKFKDTKTGKINIDALVKSYLELEKKLSNRTKLLPATSNGTMPEKPEDYQIIMKNPMLVMDKEMNKQLFELGFTNEQLQAVYDLAADKIIPLLENLSADYRADKEMAELEREFGGADAFNTIARQISAWGEKNLKPDIFNALSTSKEGIMTIYKMMNEQSEPPVLPNTPHSHEQITEDSLRALMRNPKYWKEQDPALLKRVEEGFKRLYK